MDNSERYFWIILVFALLFVGIFAGKEGKRYVSPDDPRGYHSRYSSMDEY